MFPKKLNVSQQLLLGSSEINRMKKEIHQVVQIICSMMNDRYNGVLATYTQDDDIRWQHVFREDGKRHVVDCQVRDRDEWRLMYLNSDQGKFPRIEDVQTVYEVLPIFVEGMIGMAPHLQVKLAPFLKAASTV